MQDFFTFDDDDDDGGGELGDLLGARNPRDKRNQIILSVAIGVIAFMAFCCLRPKWTTLYSARKRQKGEASALPELPDSLFGWILPLYRITDQQILASAGLDAYVFLAFFKLAIKFLLVTFFFSLTIIKPVHDANPDDVPGAPNNETSSFGTFQLSNSNSSGNGTVWLPEGWGDPDYLWMYVVLAYVFSAVAIYLIVSETRRIIELRQEYLGSQSTVTDRTIRLSGIPADLQDEARIREFVEGLDIGKVERVTLCRKWKELDDAVSARMSTLRRLEEAYTIYMGHQRVGRNMATLPISQPLPPSPRPAAAAHPDADDEAPLVDAPTQRLVMPYARVRPQVRLRYGRWKLKSKKVDAIDHYEAQLNQADARIRELRQKSFPPTPLAFVTMDSVASCQTAIQAVLDPSPLQLIASQSPAPADVVWENTYMPRHIRMLRSWSVTALITFLTIFWFAILVPIALALNVDSIGRIWPQLKDVLEENGFAQSLVNTQLPTLFVSLLMVLVPYLYYYLSWHQGMISQGDVELSAISKNFFFTFFNFFIIFTILGTASKFYQFFKNFGDALQDFSRVALILAKSLQRLLDFYVNFIILQGVGLYPVRLLEMGSVSLYPVYRMGAKTPRDYAELVQPPVFSYAFYLPNALLIFIICMSYSVLRDSWQILLAGLIFFSFGHFVYKYQLLYAMDHRQQAGGRAWGMICDRLFIGLIFFQATTAGQLILLEATPRSISMVPLIGLTIWAFILYDRTYKPLLQYIALRSVRRGEHYTDDAPSETSSAVESSASADLVTDHNVWADGEEANGHIPRISRRSSARVFDEADDEILRFVNPSLVVPLEKLWIADQIVREEPANVIAEDDAEDAEV